MGRLRPLCIGGEEALTYGTALKRSRGWIYRLRLTATTASNRPLAQVVSWLQSPTCCRICQCGLGRCPSREDVAALPYTLSQADSARVQAFKVRRSFFRRVIPIRDSPPVA